MILLRALKLVDIPEEELEKHFDKMVSGAEQMIRSRIVTMTTNDWILLSEAERLAFAEAGDRIQAETAYMIGTAVMNKEFQEQLIGEAHGVEGAKKFREANALERLRQVMEQKAQADLAIESGT